MDLYVERQCIDEMKKGDGRQFLMLFDAYFRDLYRYVARRVASREQVEKIARLTFLDALGQIQNTPVDISYSIWLYSLAKPRVWEYIAKTSFPDKQGLIVGARDDGKVGVKADARAEDLLTKMDKMMKKLSLEEREILKLKFFEEVTDGDVTSILGLKEEAIGPKIYRVLKRSHLLLFGESEAKHGVYFGELSSFFERVRNMEDKEIPEVFKLSLKADLAGRIDRREFAINGKVVEEEKLEEQISEEEMPFAVKEKGGSKVGSKVGSNDPAKIFVEAVAEMKAEEEMKKQEARERFERKERIYDFIDKWKAVLSLIPAVLFVWVAAVVVINYADLAGIDRGYPTACDIKVAFDGDFSDGEMRNVNKGVSDRLCEYFDVKRLLISRTDEGIVDVEVDVPEWLLEYNFVKKIKDWRIKKYARTPDSDEKSGKISRNI